MQHKIPMLTNREHGGIKSNLLGGLLVFAGLVVIAMLALPKPFSTDLDRIGQGKPAIAIIYEMENEAVNSLMDGFNKIREEYEHAVEFLMVDTASPKGQSFLRQNPAAAGTALFYSASGEIMNILHGPQEEHILEQSVKQVFNL